jgi:16S rRNA (cytosine967-C5)-methyltransferase
MNYQGAHDTDQPEPHNTGSLTAARSAALSILDQVLSKKQAFDQMLEQSAELAQLPGRDRGFVRMAAATALRRLGQIDDLIFKATDRKDAPSPPLLMNLLRLGAVQIAFMDVPDYAVVDTAVRIAEARGMERQKGFVNAVLRRIAAERQEWLSKQDAARLNTPEWLMKSWIADYGLRAAAEIAQANMSEAALDISLKNPGAIAQWAQLLQASALPTGGLRRPSGGHIPELPGYEDGMWWVQDAAAMLPARLFGDIQGRHVIDLCAAPGGKTAQLLASGAYVTAVDRSVSRMKRLAENMARLRFDENMLTAEIADSSVWQPREKAEFVLCDAPCSATGTLRRHPDVARLKNENDMRGLIEIQKRLLANAVKMLAPKGILIYCTCSLQKDEGERQIYQFLQTEFNMRRLPVSAVEIGGIEDAITQEGDVRLLPYHIAAMGGIDGFYISRLQKI